MTNGAGTRSVAFGVETIHLDLPPLVGAFARRLHDAGLPVTPARATDLARAIALTSPESRRRLYWTARAVLLTDPTHARTFDRVFAEVFGARPRDAFEPEDTTTVPAPPDDRPAPDHETVSGGEPGAPGAWDAARAGARDEDDGGAKVEVPLALASDEELLAGKRFDALSADELLRLQHLMTRLRLVTPLRRTRRYDAGRRGSRVDMRRTLRGSLRTAGDPVRLVRRRRRVAPRRLVLLCDISGSMEPYARAYLQFLACATQAGPNAEAFVFATRLTRLTRALGSKQPSRAIQRAAAAAPDWSSGTRIGDALKAFNDRHGRRGMARGAIVVILSDGWERGDPAVVGREMERLGRLAHRIVWVNPRVAAAGFSVQAGGMVAALPHCHALVSGHSFASLAEVVEAIASCSGDAVSTRADMPAPDEDSEPWGSATPVPGSSVAMPSGYGPSRGKTTPGWTIGGRT